MAMSAELAAQLFASEITDHGVAAKNIHKNEESDKLFVSDKSQKSVSLDMPPGGLQLCPDIAAAHPSAAAALDPQPDLKREEENKRKSEDRDSKSAAERDIDTITQWQEILHALRKRNEYRAIQLLNFYEPFLRQEANRSFLITLISKAIKVDSLVVLQKVLTMVRLNTIEKDFTFKHMMLPMVYALQHHASLAVIQTLQMSGASMKADYAPGQDATAQVHKRLQVADKALPYFASHAHSAASLDLDQGIGFMPSFSQHRKSPLIFTFVDAADPFASPHDIPSAVSALSPDHTSDLGRIQQQAARQQAEQRQLAQQLAAQKNAAQNLASYADASHVAIGVSKPAGSAAAAAAEPGFSLAGDQNSVYGDQNGEYFAYNASFHIPSPEPGQLNLDTVVAAEFGASDYDPSKDFNLGRPFGVETFR